MKLLKIYKIFYSSKKMKLKTHDCLVTSSNHKVTSAQEIKKTDIIYDINDCEQLENLDTITSMEVEKFKKTLKN